VAEWLADEIKEKHGIETQFEDDGLQKPLDDDIRTILFHNVRELLTNVIKYAQAQRVKVSISRVDETVHVSVEDDGVGFDAVEVISMAAKSDKFGLFSIRERLEQLGGLIEIDSAPGRGSRLHIEGMSVRRACPGNTGRSRRWQILQPSDSRCSSGRLRKATVVDC
jgi:signal transduction histidine kinase